jgi:ABC-type spermidine/putrescine transport system permease subunit II
MVIRATALRLATLLTGCVAVLLLAPLAVMIASSFSHDAYRPFPLASVSTSNYIAFLTSSVWRTATLNSLLVASVSALVAVGTGAPLAWALARASPRLQLSMLCLVAIPVLVPAMVGAVSLYRMSASFALVPARAVLIAAHASLGLPLVVGCVFPAARRISDKLLVSAASLGASPVRIIWSTILPQLWPSIAGGWLLACATSLDELVFAMFLTDSSTETLPVKMWRGMRFDLDPAVTVVGSMIAFGSVGLFWLAYLIIGGVRSSHDRTI